MASALASNAKLAVVSRQQVHETALSLTPDQMEEAVEVFSLFDPSKEGHVDLRSDELMLLVAPL